MKSHSGPNSQKLIPIRGLAMFCLYRRLIFGAITFLLLTGLTVPSAAAPGVRFKRYNEYYERESVGTVTLLVELTEVPTEPVSISWETQQTFSAAPGLDYVYAAGELAWAVGDDSDREIVVTVLQDELEEPREDFAVALLFDTAVGLESRAPNTGFVFIIDDDRSAYFVVDDIVGLNWLGRLGLVGWDDDSIELTIRLPDPPVEPVTVQYYAYPDPTIHTVVFDGVQEQTVTIDAVAVPPGEDQAAREIGIIGSPDRGAGQWQDIWYTTTRHSQFMRSQCAMCFLNVIMNGLGYDVCEGTCVFGTPCNDKLSVPYVPKPWYTALTRYRDEILSQTPSGLNYTTLYENLSADVIDAFLEHPWFVYEVFRAREEWTDGILAIVDGTADTVVITDTMQTSLNLVIDRFIELGSVELVTVVEEVTALLDLRNLAGRTMVELQNTVDSGGVSIESVTWGSLKAGYR